MFFVCWCEYVYVSIRLCINSIIIQTRFIFIGFDKDGCDEYGSVFFILKLQPQKLFKRNGNKCVFYDKKVMGLL